MVSKILKKFNAFKAVSVQNVFCTGTPCGPTGRDLQGHRPKEYGSDIAKILIIIQFEISYHRSIEVYGTQNNSPVTCFVRV